MPYTKFQLRCIELGLCIQCGEYEVKKFRRCVGCRAKGPRRKTRANHCRRGHKLTPENTYYRTNGGRECRKCRGDYWSSWWKKRKANWKQAENLNQRSI